MNTTRIKEKVQRIIELSDSIADEYQHNLNLHAFAGIPAGGVGSICQLVRIIETAERTARDFQALIDHPNGLGVTAFHVEVVPGPGRLEPSSRAGEGMAGGHG